MIALLVAASGDPPPACHAGDLKQDFLRAYRPTTAGLRKHLAKNRRLRLMVTNYVGDGQMVSKVELELLANSRCLLGKDLSAVRKGNDFSFQGVKPVWYLCRPDNVFTIAPAKNSGHHVITGMTKPKEHWEQIDLPVRLALYPLVEPLSQLSIVDYVSRDGIDVVGMEERPWQGATLTCVEVRDPLHRAKQVWHRRLYFDRARNWLFHGMEHYGDENPKRMYVARCFYRASEGGLPVPERYEAHLEDGEARRPRVRVEYLEFARANPDDSEFQLSRFDLPEPEALSDRAPTRWYPWLFAAGGLVCLLAMVASRYARQKDGWLGRRFRGAGVADMNRCLCWAAVCLLWLVALALFTRGLFLAFPTGGDAPAVHLAATATDLGRVAVGEQVIVDVVLVNPHAAPRRLVGVGKY